MPNIIEQQDLLKGLPDNRLALLMQSPVADIPPFLVAAEAQRRQAIRQQFSGDAGKESVVDTLTKQLANVPQNVQAPMQKPPQLPPPMAPQAGIGAIQPQQMAGGGRVQRYGPGGEVQPMWRLPDYSGSIPKVVDWVGGAAKSVYDYATTPWGEQATPAEETPASKLDIPALPDKPLPKPSPKYSTAGEPAPYTDLTPKVKTDTTTSDTSIENQAKAKEAEFRKRIKELYGADQPSNWEEAQKWFAMSAQILNPDATLMQGLVNAGAVYAGAEGEQASQQRQAKRDEAEAMLKYDMGLYESEQDRAAAGVKARTDVSVRLLDDLYRRQSDIADQMRKIDDSLMKGEYTDTAAAQAMKNDLQRRYNAIGGKIASYEDYIGSTYGFANMPTVDLSTNTIK